MSSEWEIEINRSGPTAVANSVASSNSTSNEVQTPRKTRNVATGGGTLTTVYRAVYRVTDLDAGIVEQTFGREFAVAAPRAWMKSLAMAPPTTIDVPTLGGAAMALLALLLTGAGVAVLRHRRR